MRLGQHADKSIKTSAKIDQLDIVPFVPADMAKMPPGKLNGTLEYATDSSSRNITGGRHSVAGVRRATRLGPSRPFRWS